MIRIAKGDRAYCEAFIQSLKARVSENDRSVEDKVAEILKDVRDNGDEAVRRYTMKFDAGESGDHKRGDRCAYRRLRPGVYRFDGARRRKYPRVPRQTKAAKPHRPLAHGCSDGSARARPAQGRRVCAGRYGSVPVLCFDERYPGENCRSRRDRHGHAAGTYRQAG